MRRHNADNERIKRKYLIFEKEARQQNEVSIDSIAKSIARFEEHTKWKDFKRFHFEQAIDVKKHLAKQQNQVTGKPLSKSTLNGTLAHLAKFFQWLSQQSGCKSRIAYSDSEYFRLSAKDTRIANASRITVTPTIDQIKKAVSNMPSGTDIGPSAHSFYLADRDEGWSYSNVEAQARQSSRPVFLARCEGG